MPRDIDTDRILQETFVVSLEHHRRVGSTNDIARQQAKQKSEGQLPLLIVADSQTAGRGRGNHKWWTGNGSLAFSLLISQKMAKGRPGNSTLVGLATAVAIVEVIRSIAPTLELGIHWPNDVFVSGRKLAGILVEVLYNRLTVIGVGLNTNNKMEEAPPELAEIATTMTELTGKSYNQTNVLVGLLKTLENTLSIMAKDPSEIGSLADSFCLQRGETLTVRCGKELTTGRAAGIAIDGALLLDTKSGLQSIYSGQLE